MFQRNIFWHMQIGKKSFNNLKFSFSNSFYIWAEKFNLLYMVIPKSFKLKTTLIIVSTILHFTIFIYKYFIGKFNSFICDKHKKCSLIALINSLIHFFIVFLFVWCCATFALIVWAQSELESFNESSSSWKRKFWTKMGSGVNVVQHQTKRKTMKKWIRELPKN